jgi:putative membrane protein
MNRKSIVLSTGLATGLAAATLAFGQGYYGPGMMGGYGPGYGWGGGWGLGIVGMLLWWVLIVLGIALLAKWLFGASHWHGHKEASGRALDILKERYARGEIDKKEFEEKKRDLQ